MRFSILAIISILFLYCDSSIKIEVKQEQPNILWIVTEDISPTLSFYGDNTAKTPNLDKLAEESLVYDNAFTPVGVCAPSRSSIITGMHPTSIGTIHMRTSHDVFSWGRRNYSAKVDIKDIEGDTIRKYSAVIPDYVKCYTEYMREAGYYCTNNYKTDYQFAAPVTSWDENNQKAHWRNGPKGKPFFSIFNIDITHESYLWRNDTLPLTVNPKDVIVPPYLPDNEATRNTIARHYSNVELMDKRVEKIINQLKNDGLYDNTIIFFYSDHGGPLPRGKRAILDSGLKVPFLVKDNKGTTGRTDRLISFVDLAPTMLSLAGVKPKDYMEGYAFMGEYDTIKRGYVFGSSDRFDEFTDRIRSVRNKKYLYLRNSFPELPKYKDVAYRKNIPMMSNFLKLRDEGRLNDVQKIWFETKTTEELYDVEKDPYQINNLAENPKFASTLKEMRTILNDFQKDKTDYGVLPEAKMIKQMWPNFKQPITEDVVIKKQDGKVILSTNTIGASIAYIVSDEQDKKIDFNSGWSLYTKPIEIDKGKYIFTMAERIGFRESSISKHQIQ